MRQEVISDEEAHEDPVVDNALEVVLERDGLCNRLELHVEIFTQQRQVQQEHVRVGERDVLLRLAAERDLLTEQTEMRVVANETEHDQVGIETVETVAGVGVVTGLSLGFTDEVHNLVLSFSRDLGVSYSYGSSSSPHDR